MDGDGIDPARQFVAAWKAAGAVLGEWAQRVTAATAEACSKLDPAFRAAIEAGRAVLRGDRRDCECPCGEAHPDDVGVCDNDAVITRRFATDLDGEVDVPLCAPCATAQGLAELSG